MSGSLTAGWEQLDETIQAIAKDPACADLNGRPEFASFAAAISAMASKPPLEVSVHGLPPSPPGTDQVCIVPDVCLADSCAPTFHGGTVSIWVTINGQFIEINNMFALGVAKKSSGLPHFDLSAAGSQAYGLSLVAGLPIIKIGGVPFPANGAGDTVCGGLGGVVTCTSFGYGRLIDWTVLDPPPSPEPFNIQVSADADTLFPPC